jgi:hypothetical protein
MRFVFLPFRTGYEILDRLTQKLPSTVPEKTFRLCIDAENSPTRVDHEGGVRHPLEQIGSGE